jgi:TolA-binding protein
MFLFCLSASPAVAADTATEIEQLKSEMQKLMKKIEDLEKKQSETQTKTVETEKKVEEVAKKAEKVEKKALKDRIEFGGEAASVLCTIMFLTGFMEINRVQILNARDTSFLLRIDECACRSCADWVDVYARLI